MALTNRMRPRVQHPDCSYSEKDPSRGRAKQQFKEDCDLNNLIAKYRKLGVWPSGAPGVYEDEVAWPKDLAQAFEITARAAEQFEALPAQVRRRLGNDPSRLLELEEEDLKDLRAYISRQERPKGAPDDQGSGGGRPPGKEAAPKAQKPPKGEPKAKPESDDQE